MSTRNKGTPAKKAASKKPAKRKAAPKAKKVLVSKKKPVARKKAKPRAVSPARVNAAAKAFHQAIDEHMEQKPKKRFRFRDAITGLFVRMGFAKKNPDTTVRESR